MTGGEYHLPRTAEALRSVYENLGSRVQVQTRETAVAALLALLSAGFAFTAGGCRWSGIGALCERLWRWKSANDRRAGTLAAAHWPLGLE